MGLPPEQIANVGEALQHARAGGPFWSVNSEQLNVNLIRLSAGQGIAEHVNGELDVLLAVFAGSGELLVDGAMYPLGVGSVVVVPRGARRSLRCVEGPLFYLSTHRQRGGLMPI